MEFSELKKSVVISFFMFLIIQITTLISYSLFEKSTILFISLVWLFLTVLLFKLIKRKGPTIIYILMNAVMAGIALSCYYVYEDIALYNITATSFLYFFLLAANYFVMYLLNFKPKANIIVGVISILGLLIGVYLWIDVNLIIGSSIVFTSVILLSLNISLLYYLHHGGDYNSWRIIKLSSMLMFGCIFLAVIIAITDGDILEMFDVSGANQKKKSITK